MAQTSSDSRGSLGGVVKGAGPMGTARGGPLQ